MPVKRDHRRVTVLVLQEAAAMLVAAVKEVTLTATACPRWIAVVVVPLAKLLKVAGKILETCRAFVFTRKAFRLRKMATAKGSTTLQPPMSEFLGCGRL